MVKRNNATCYPVSSPFVNQQRKLIADAVSSGKGAVQIVTKRKFKKSLYKLK